MLITMTQRQIEREAEKDLDAAQRELDFSECVLRLARRRCELDSSLYSSALSKCDRARGAYADAVKNLEKTSCEEENLDEFDT